MRRQVTLLENRECREKGGGIISREIGIKVSIIITIRGLFNLMFCNFNEDGGLGRRLCE